MVSFISMNLKKFSAVLCIIVCVIDMIGCILGYSIVKRTLLSPSRRTIGQRLKFSSFSDIFNNESELKVSVAYSRAKYWLMKNGIEDSEESARHLLCHAANLGTRYSDFHNNLDKVLNPIQLNSFADYCIQRSQNCPIQYIIGNWDFYGFTFQCKPPVLIPRPETEELVEKILQSQQHLKSSQPLSILDIGAGTGAIGISLSAHLPHAKVTAIDINPVAVDLANANAATILGPNYADRYTCLLVGFDEFADQREYQNAFDLIVSNPPYIPSADLASLQPEVRLFEDHRALDGGIDGLALVRKIVTRSASLLRQQDISAGHIAGHRELWLEVSHTHPPALAQAMSLAQEQSQDNIFHKNQAYELVNCYNDLFGAPRFVRFRYHHKTVVPS